MPHRFVRFILLFLLAVIILAGFWWVFTRQPGANKIKYVRVPCCLSPSPLVPYKNRMDVADFGSGYCDFWQHGNSVGEVRVGG